MKIPIYMYRQNGYATIGLAEEKRMADNSDYVKEFGRPDIHLKYIPEKFINTERLFDYHNKVKGETMDWCGFDENVRRIRKNDIIRNYEGRELYFIKRLKEVEGTCYELQEENADLLERNKLLFEYFEIMVNEVIKRDDIVDKAENVMFRFQRKKLAEGALEMSVDELADSLLEFERKD